MNFWEQDELVSSPTVSSPTGNFWERDEIVGPSPTSIGTTVPMDVGPLSNLPPAIGPQEPFTGGFGYEPEKAPTRPEPSGATRSFETPEVQLKQDLQPKYSALKKYEEDIKKGIITERDIATFDTAKQQMAKDEKQRRMYQLEEVKHQRERRENLAEKFADVEQGGFERKVKSFAKATVPQMLEGVGGMLEMFEVKDTGKAMRRLGERLEDNYLHVHDPTFWDEVAGGFGSSAMFLVPGMGVMKGAKVLGAAPRIAAMLGTSTSAVLEAGMEAGDTYNQLIADETVDPNAAKNKAETVFMQNIPLNYVLDKWIFKDTPKGMQLKQLIKRTPSEMVSGGGQEMVQEFIQSAISNYAMKDEVNWEEAYKSGLIGLITGGVTAGGKAGIDVAGEALKEKPTTKQPQPPPTTRRRPLFSEYEAIKDKKERQRVYEMNEVTGRPGTPAFQRIFLNATKNETEPVVSASGDVNGFKVYNDLLSEEDADVLNGKIYDAAESVLGPDVAANLHGDEYASMATPGESQEQLVEKLKLVAEEVAKIDVEIKGKIYHPTFKWLIGNPKSLKEFGKLNPKKYGPNTITFDKTGNGDYITVRASDIDESQIVTRDKFLGVKNENGIPGPEGTNAPIGEQVGQGLGVEGRVPVGGEVVQAEGKREGNKVPRKKIQGKQPNEFYAHGIREGNIYPGLDTESIAAKDLPDNAAFAGEPITKHILTKGPDAGMVEISIENITERVDPDELIFKDKEGWKPVEEPVEEEKPPFARAKAGEGQADLFGEPLRVTKEEEYKIASDFVNEIKDAMDKVYGKEYSVPAKNTLSNFFDEKGAPSIQQTQKWLKETHSKVWEYLEKKHLKSQPQAKPIDQLSLFEKPTGQEAIADEQARREKEAQKPDKGLQGLPLDETLDQNQISMFSKTDVERNVEPGRSTMLTEENMPKAEDFRKFFRKFPKNINLHTVRSLGFLYGKKKMMRGEFKEGQLGVLYEGRTGNDLYFFLNPRMTPEQAAGVIVHEFGHFGSEKVFEQYPKLRNRLNTFYNADMAGREEISTRYADDVKNLGPEESARYLKNEWVSENLRLVYEKGKLTPEKAGIVQKIRELFRDFFIRIGMKEDTIDDVMRSMARQMGKGMEARVEGPQFMHQAYHGSPYKFEKFSTEKIGTGEGAQAFGWGLYFTSERDIAKDYAERLSQYQPKDYDKIQLKIKGKTPAEITEETGNDELEKYVNEILGGPNLYEIPEYDGAKEYGVDGIRETIKEAIEYEDDPDVVKKLKNYMPDKWGSEMEWIIPEKSEQKIYTVTLHKGKDPSEYDYLRWENTVTDEQENKIRNQFSKEHKANDLFVPYKVQISKRLFGTDWKSFKGRDVYQELSNVLGSDKEASLFLLRAGIDGIKYPAGTLSGQKSDAFNYVIFDESAATIDEVSQFARSPEEANVRAKVRQLGMEGKNVTLISDDKGNVRRMVDGKLQDDIVARLPSQEEADRYIERVQMAEVPMFAREPVTKDQLAAEYDKAGTFDGKAKAKELKKQYSNNIHSAGLIKYGTRTVAGRLMNVSPEIRDVMQKHVNKIILDTRNYMVRIEPFLKKLSKMELEDYKKFDLAAKNADQEAFDPLIEKYKMRKEYSDYRLAMDEIVARADKAGYDTGYLKNYFPRLAKDKSAYRNFVRGTPAWGSIEEAIREKEKEIGRDMTEEEKDDFISLYLRGYGNKITLAKPGSLQERKLQYIDNEMNSLLEDTKVALPIYVENLVKKINRKELFNSSVKRQWMKEKVKKLEGQLQKKLIQTDLFADYEEKIKKEYNDKMDLYINDLDESIGSYVAQLIDDKKLDPQKQDELIGLLKSYFGYKPTNATIATIKGLSHATAIGSGFSSMFSQAQDAYAIYHTAFKPATAATVKALFGKTELTTKDLGIGEPIAAEFRDPGWLAKYVDKNLSWVGMKLGDNAFKNAFIEANLQKFRKMAKTGKMTYDFKNDLQNIFGDESGQVVEDLKSGKNSDNVKLLLLNQISKFQPITLLQVPQMYLDRPGFRVIYTLKVYQVAQMNAVIDEAERAMQGAKTKEAYARAFLRVSKVIAFLIASGVGMDALKDFIFRRKATFGQYLLDNALKLVLISRYITWKARTDGYYNAAINVIAPPFNWIDYIGKDITKAVTNPENFQLKNMETIRAVPVFGQELYWWWGGGAEREAKTKRGEEKEFLGNVSEIRKVRSKHKELEKLAEEASPAEQNRMWERANKYYLDKEKILEYSRNPSKGELNAVGKQKKTQLISDYKKDIDESRKERDAAKKAGDKAQYELWDKEFKTLMKLFNEEYKAMTK